MHARARRAGLGDDVQNMKAGLMEVADIFVLNKAEREGADRLEQQLQAMLELAPGNERRGWQPPIVRTTATEGKGIGELAEAIEKFHRAAAKQAANSAPRCSSIGSSACSCCSKAQLLARALGDEGQRALESLASEVAERKKNPYDCGARAVSSRRTSMGDGRERHETRRPRISHSE